MEIMFKAFFKFFLILFAFGITSNALAQSYPGFNLSDWPEDFKKQLFAAAPDLENKKFTEQQLNDLLKRLSENIYFTQLSIVEKDNQLFLLGTINSTVQAIEIRNLEAMPIDEAKEVLSLQLDEANNESKVNLQIEKLLNEYRNRGYRQTRATFSYESLQTGQRKLVIQINEGPRTKIISTEIIGLDVDL